MSLQKSAVVNLDPRDGFCFSFHLFSFSVCLSSLRLSALASLSLSFFIFL